MTRVHLSEKKKITPREFLYKTKSILSDSQTWRTDLCLPRGRGWGKEGLGVWDQQMQTIIYRMDKQ